MSVEVRWIHHASFRLADGTVVYIDPWKIDSAPADGQLVFVSHAHYDHCSAEDVRKVCAAGGTVVAPPDAAAQLAAKALTAGETVELAGVKITGVPAYNVGKQFHPQSSRWLGAVLEIGGARIYYAGDTDRVPEMTGLKGIDLALLPVGGTYTMDAGEAAQAAADIGCRAAVPYHFGDIVGSTADARRSADAAGCTVHVLSPGQSVQVGS